MVGVDRSNVFLPAIQSLITEVGRLEVQIRKLRFVRRTLQSLEDARKPATPAHHNKQRRRRKPVTSKRKAYLLRQENVRKRAINIMEQS